MNHEESKLQQQCAVCFRAEHREYASLLTHPINEGGANTRVSGAIHKAEGTVAGVPDFLLFLPAEYDRLYFGLGIELKTPTGKQSQQQKDFQLMFQAAGFMYLVVRSLDEFRLHVNDWMKHVPEYIQEAVASAYRQLMDEDLQRQRAKLQRIINKK